MHDIHKYNKFAKIAMWHDYLTDNKEFVFGLFGDYPEILQSTCTSNLKFDFVSFGIVLSHCYTRI